jgi:hypothetical protein
MKCIIKSLFIMLSLLTSGAHAAAAVFESSSLGQLPNIVESNCKLNSSLDCTYASSLHAPTTESPRNTMGRKLTSNQLIDTVRRCLLSGFAYNNPTQNELNLKSREITQELMRYQADFGIEFYDASRATLRRSATREFIIQESCNIGGPDCALVAFEPPTNFFVAIAADACD